MMALRLLLLFAGAAASPATAQNRAFGSVVPALRITPTDILPRAPGQRLDEYCANEVVTPRGPAARAVAARGWHVTGEARVGTLVAVSFVAGLEPATSGLCLVEGGNVGLFEGARLVAIVHAARSDGGPLRRIGATSVPGRLRLWPEAYTPPLADLVARGEGAAVVPVAASENWCGGIAIPTAYGLTIATARRRILAAGWRPAPPPAAEIAATSGRDFDFRRAGISELEVCSGTGFGLCLFNYRHPRGARLQVQTAGEAEAVVDQRVTCAAPRRGR
jgi:hypothetical protein